MSKGDCITITSDDAKCTHCGLGFDARHGRYGLPAIGGVFHAVCLQHFVPTTHGLGLIAGLNEAALIAEKHREERFRARDEAKAAKSPKAARDHESMAIEAGHIEASIRARIAALEEEGKSHEHGTYQVRGVVGSQPD